MIRTRGVLIAGLVGMAALAALTACKGKASSTRSQAASGSASSASSAGSAASKDVGSAHAGDPWVQVDAAPDTPEARQKRADAALGRVAAIMPELAKLRALTFDRDVPRELQPPDVFRTFVRTEIAKDLPPDKSHDQSAALFQLGLLKQAVDLAQVEEQAFTTQAGAYYDPATKKFFVVMVPDSDLMLDTMSAHELTHALQDQHFDLKAFLPTKADGTSALDDDQASARRFIAEGDATLAMLIYGVAHPLKKASVDAGMIKMLEPSVKQFSSMDLAQLTAMNKEQSAAFGSMDPEIKKSMDAMETIPPIILAPMIDSYMKGAWVCLVAFEHGGWPAVNELYKDPPESTEQVLHPETKLYPHRDHPRKVTLPAPSRRRSAPAT